MTFTLAMHERSFAHIRDQLDPLGLDCRVLTFDDDGMFDVDGETIRPGEVDADYIWLSVQIGTARQKAFETALSR